MLKLNQSAPNFSLPSTSGDNFELNKNAVNQPLIIYFYPKDNTKVCTKEACQFRDNFEILRSLNINIVGISTDTIEKHQQFKAKYNLPFELLSDKDGKVSKLYKARVPFLNMSKRITYLLNHEHQIIEAVEDLFSAEVHINKILAQLKVIKK